MDLSLRLVNIQRGLSSSQESLRLFSRDCQFLSRARETRRNRDDREKNVKRKHAYGSRHEFGMARALWCERQTTRFEDEWRHDNEDRKRQGDDQGEVKGEDADQDADRGANNRQ